MYNGLLEQGITPQYEPRQFSLWPGFEPVTPFYNKETDSQYEKRGGDDGKQLRLQKAKVIAIRYTPDLYFKYGDFDVWLEIKGLENDIAYIKKKLFRKYLDEVYLNTGQKSLYFEIYNKRHLLQALKIIKDYSENRIEYEIRKNDTKNIE